MCSLLGFAVTTQSHKASQMLSWTLRFTTLPLKCRWFFGRVFSFPLVEEFV